MAVGKMVMVSVVVELQGGLNDAMLVVGGECGGGKGGGRAEAVLVTITLQTSLHIFLCHVYNRVSTCVN